MVDNEQQMLEAQSAFAVSTETEYEMIRMKFIHHQPQAILTMALSSDKQLLAVAR